MRASPQEVRDLSHLTVEEKELAQQEAEDRRIMEQLKAREAERKRKVEELKQRLHKEQEAKALKTSERKRKTWST